MTEQINQESNSVETPRDATEVFTEMLEAEAVSYTHLTLPTN